MTKASPPPPAEHFNAWYADMVDSPAKDEFVQRHLGLPGYLVSSSLLTWDGLTEVIAALRLTAGQTLLDLACGRGSYGLEVAERTGAHLVGVDFSAEAVRQAELNAARLNRSASFQVGDLTATGLATGSVDGVMCIDSIQFAVPPDDAYREIRRVLAPGGRAVLTSWEPVDRLDQRLPDRLRSVDLYQGLTAAGFVDVVVEERPGWAAVERGLWQEAVALDPGTDPALTALREEGGHVLQLAPLRRRVIATASAG